MDREESPCTDTPPSDFGAVALDSWTVGLATIAMAAHFCLLGRGRPRDPDRSSSTKEPQMMS